jgi:hypothetical protein
VNGVLERVKAVHIVGERCKNGIKEIKLERASSDKNVIWTKHDTNAIYIEQSPTVMDPYEQKSIYVDQSEITTAEYKILCRQT